MTDIVHPYDDAVDAGGSGLQSRAALGAEIVKVKHWNASTSAYQDNGCQPGGDSQLLVIKVAEGDLDLTSEVVVRRP